MVGGEPDGVVSCDNNSLGISCRVSDGLIGAVLAHVACDIALLNADNEICGVDACPSALWRCASPHVKTLVSADSIMTAVDDAWTHVGCDGERAVFPELSRALLAELEFAFLGVSTRSFVPDVCRMGGIYGIAAVGSCKDDGV